MSAKKPSGIVMRVAVVLLCLVLFSSHLASGMFARYAVSADESGTAKVAKYGVKVSPATDDASDPLGIENLNGDVAYRFKIDNSGSQIAVSYDAIQVSFYDSVAGNDVSAVSGQYEDVKLSGVNAQGDPVEYTCDAPVIDSDSGKVTYVYAVNGYVAPGAASGEFVLSFNTYPSWKITTDDSLMENTIKLGGNHKYPVDVTVHAEQVN